MDLGLREYGIAQSDPYPASLKLGGGESLEGHSRAVATSVLSDLVFVTNESLLKFYERKRSRYEEGLGIIDPRGQEARQRVSARASAFVVQPAEVRERVDGAVAVIDDARFRCVAVERLVERLVAT